MFTYEWRQEVIDSLCQNSKDPSMSFRDIKKKLKKEQLITEDGLYVRPANEL